MIKAVIIEDEDFAVNRLRMLLEESADDVEIIAMLDSVQDAVRWLSVHEVDLIFLDINLSDGNAFKIFEQVDITTPVIFTTAYHEYALRAFEQYSIDYLLKPISREKLGQALVKYRTLRQVPKTLDEDHFRQLFEEFMPRKSRKKLMVTLGNKMKVLGIRDIAYFISDSKVTYVHTFDNKRYPVDASLRQLESELPEYDFFRVNRQFLIGRAVITELHYISPIRVKVLLSLPSKEEILVAREKVGQFKKWLTE
ncbi:DNA-binding response regulator [Fulvitalea axinellae]|uniref:DNA-binding response regulator n=1 Tax=Fulvitalea axinellae TaxID=1182444 RepID=A0AAU9CLU6_9BACT|nr:DNA-binding response regulator [Fulvitalea axinellae]